MAASVARIEVRLRELAQLFNSMDPSPFLDRDLDADADEFIVSWARQHSPASEFELVVHLSAPAPGDGDAGLQEAVQHYYQVRAQLKQREFQVLMRHGRLSLLIGLAFLFGCLFVGGFVGRLGAGAGAAVARESLAILGWVAMWRPLQIYLYDWWPLREERRLFERLARATVRLMRSAPGA